MALKHSTRVGGSGASGWGCGTELRLAGPVRSALREKLVAVLGIDLSDLLQGDLCTDQRHAGLATGGVFALGRVLHFPQLADPIFVIVLQVLRLNTVHFANSGFVCKVRRSSLVRFTGSSTPLTHR